MRLRVYPVLALLGLVAACGASDLNDVEPPPGTDDGGVDAATDRASPGDASVADTSTDAATDARDASDGGAPATVTVGAADRILLLGTVITPDVTFVGQVLVEGSLITCVAPALGCQGQVGAIGATIIDTHGVIAPGLVDTHNHILFDIFDDSDWLPTQAYTNHKGWPSEPRYQAMLDVKQCLEDASQGKPTWCPATYDGVNNLKCEMDKWGELKGMIAGTTSIVGLAGTTSACFGSLARSIDASQNGLGQDKIQTSALFPPSKTAADGVCANFASMKTDAYLIHVGEGTDPAALAEFAKLGTASTTEGCLYAPQTAITHGTAFTSVEFAQMAAANMKLTWSPASNVALYGSTTNIPAALDANVTIALGARAKTHGEKMTGQATELSAVEEPAQGEGGRMEAYERLLGDAMLGDPTLFARQDVVEAAWAIVDPVIHGPSPLYGYDAGTWGPKEAEALTASVGGWNTPK